MWALVTKNGATKPLSHRFAALWEPIWGLCGFIGQSQKVNSRKPGFRCTGFLETEGAQKA